jgi:hypothetical protein
VLLAQFLNADLELWHDRPLTRVISALRPAMFTLYAGRESGLIDPRDAYARRRGYYAKLELETPRRLSAERTALQIVKLVRSLPPGAAKLWNELEVRRLSFGYDAHRHKTAGIAHLRHGVLAACASVGLEFEVCIYPAKHAGR